MSSLQSQLREAREAAGLSVELAATLVGVAPGTWRRWEGQTSRETAIPYAYWELFMLKVGRHPTHKMVERGH
jgi:transcriptional regulator with XRE-family HTH domain